MRERFGTEVELWFILGADAAQDLPRWHRIEQILALTRLAIVARPGHQCDLTALHATLPTLVGRATLIHGPRLEISSSDLRRRLAEGLPVRYQLPEAVRQFILMHQLYQYRELSQ